MTEAKLYTCPNCGGDYQHPSRHWAVNPDCDYPDYTPKMIEYIKGFILGDGHLDRQYPEKPLLEINSISLQYLTDVSNRFGAMAGKPKLSRSGEEQGQTAQRYYERTGDDKFSKYKDNFSDLYKMYIWSHPELAKYSHWYDTVGKRIPKNETLSPEMLTIWYCSDGNLDNGKPSLAAPSFIERSPEAVLSLFDNTPINPKIGSQGVLKFNYIQRKNLFDYMEGPPVGMEYKWLDSHKGEPVGN